MFSAQKVLMVSPDNALPGRAQPMAVSEKHAVLGTTIAPPFPKNTSCILFGMGCFWGAEKCFWKVPGVYTTAVGYAGGYTPNAHYEEVCSGLTGHNEVVLVVFDHTVLCLSLLLKIFWESHDPTQGMRQGNDVGTQYRSGIYCYSVEHFDEAIISRNNYANELKRHSYGEITTEIVMPSPEFYYAEDYHQQYLAKNPQGYCGLGGTGILCHDI